MKSKKTKQKHQDFKKVKLRVGKKLPKGQNVTDASFKSRSIQLPSQLKSQQVTEPTTRRKLNISELLSHCQHYNSNMRQDALSGLRELVTTHPAILLPNLSTLLENTAQLFLDKDSSVRSANHKLWRILLGQVSANQIAPFFSVISAYLCCAMTHIQDEIQADSLVILDLCLEQYPRLMTSISGQLLPNFLEQISTHSDSAKKAGERSLIVKPGGKLSGQKWRLKVLQRLLKLLEASVKFEGASAVGTADPSSDFTAEEGTSCPVVASVNERCSTHFMPTGTSSVRDVESLETGFRLRSTTFIATTEKFIDMLHSREELQEFIQTLVPLLLESWVEVGPSQLASSLPGNSLNAEAMSTLSCVLGVLQLLLRLLERAGSDAGVRKTGLHWMRQKYLKDFIQYFMLHFPYSLPEKLPQSQKDKKRSGDKSKTELPQLSIHSLNLSVCEVMVQFVQPTESAPRNSWCEKLALYVKTLLSGSRLSPENTDSLLRIVGQLLVNCSAMPDDLIQPLVEGVCNAVISRPSNSADARFFLHFISKFLSDAEFATLREKNSAVITRVQAALPKKLLEVAGQNETTTTLLLSLISKMVAEGQHSFCASLKEHLCNFPELLSLLSPMQQRQLVEIFYYQEEIPRSSWQRLCKVCQKSGVSPEIVMYLLQVLHARLEKMLKLDQQGEILHYFSFLLSLAVGHSAEELEELQSSNRSENHIVVAQDLSHEVWRSSQLKCEAVIETLKLFPHSQDVTTICRSFCGRLLEKKCLPLDSAVAVCDLLTLNEQVGSASEEALPENLVKSLARIMVDLSTCTLGLKSQELAAELNVNIFQSCAKCAAMFPEASKKMIENALSCSEPETLLPIITLLTKLITGSHLNQHAARMKPGLISLLENVDQNIDEMQWWADFKYAVSMFTV